MAKKIQSTLTRYVPDTYVAEIFSVSRASIWRWCSDPEIHFPKPVRIGKGSARWSLAEIEAWEASRRV
jgi:prophage regulatory protein